MPRLVEGTQTAGRLRADLVSELGLAGDVIVAGGAGDNAASAVGMGAVEAGDGFLSLGTSGVLFAVNDRYSPNAESAVHAFCHAIPDTWHQMGVIFRRRMRSTGFHRLPENRLANSTINCRTSSAARRD